MSQDNAGPRIVPDASVILKWVLDAENEPGHHQAQQLLEQWVAAEVVLWVPSLWVYEVGNVLCLKRPNVASETLGFLLDLGLREVAVDQDLVELATGLATQFAVTFYDAAYLAAATAVDGILVTADRRFARSIGSSQRVKLI
jgi:predicted nucleic acid-binding protein